jgi:DNA polymerase elongation subunit (family B)
MGQLDSLLISYLKNLGISCRNMNTQKKEESFKGAFVKEPIIGIHDWIVDFDFSSLYPNLICTYNIGVNSFCMKFEDTSLGYDFMYNLDNFPNEVNMILDPTFENISVKMTKEELIKKVKDEKLISTISGCFFYSHNKEESVLIGMIEFLLKSRANYRELKSLAKDDNNKDLESLYDTRQLVIKVLSNALYGVLGNNYFRFYNLDCAKSITMSGQEATKTCMLETNSYINFIKDNCDEAKRIIPNILTKEEMYGDLTRITPNVIAGDTDSIFATYKHIVDKNKSENEIINDMNKYSEKIQNFLNNDIVRNITKRRNVPDDKHRLSFKNEMVIRRGLFVAKKNYAVYVLYDKGKIQNEILSAGIETKKSDYPSYTKECLEELLEIVLKSDKISIIMIHDFIKLKEKEFIKRIDNGSKTIAKPSSFNKDEEDYKSMTPGVKGMLNWNKLMYEAFSRGSKGYYFKIQGLNQELAPKEVLDKYHKEFIVKGKKLDSICVPDEELSLPNWFIIDRKHTLKFSWQDRHKHILEPLMETKNPITSMK